MKIPFLEYFHDLIYIPTAPSCPNNIYLNNARTDLKNIMTFHGKLSFTENKRQEPCDMNKQIGLYGNFRSLHPKTDAIYFTSLLVDE